jgi:hypothetical protein
MRYKNNREAQVLDPVIIPGTPPRVGFLLELKRSGVAIVIYADRTWGVITSGTGFHAQDLLDLTVKHAAEIEYPS